MTELIYIQQEGWLLDEVRKLFKEYEQELDEDLCFQNIDDEIKFPLRKYGPPRGVLYIAKWNSEVAKDLKDIFLTCLTSSTKPPFK